MSKSDLAKPASMRRTKSTQKPDEVIEANEDDDKVQRELEEEAINPPCDGCGAELEASDNYCHTCGTPRGARVVINLELEEIRDYLFQGYIQREFKLFEDILGDDAWVLTIRSLQSGDHESINGEISKYVAAQGGIARMINDDYLGYRRSRQLARALVAVNGVEFDDVDKALEQINSMAPDVLAIVQDHFNGLVRAVSAAIKSERRVKKL